eukprot:2065544-Prymnesium_polylepis.1
MATACVLPEASSRRRCPALSSEDSRLNTRHPRDAAPRTTTAATYPYAQHARAALVPPPRRDAARDAARVVHRPPERLRSSPPLRVPAVTLPSPVHRRHGRSELLHSEAALRRRRPRRVVRRVVRRRAQLLGRRRRRRHRAERGFLG